MIYEIGHFKFTPFIQRQTYANVCRYTSGPQLTCLSGRMNVFTTWFSTHAVLLWRAAKGGFNLEPELKFENRTFRCVSR